MKHIRRMVVAALLAVWFFPAAGLASPPPASAPALSAPALQGEGANRPSSAEMAGFAAREKQTPNLGDFKGGAVYIYLGSGAVLVLVIILVILLI
jgi:hypothetical protein